MTLLTILVFVVAAALVYGMIDAVRRTDATVDDMPTWARNALDEGMYF